MNIFNGAHLNTPVPSLAKMKRKRSGDSRSEGSSGSSSSSRLTPLDILQRITKTGDGPKRGSRSDNSLQRFVVSTRSTTSASPTIIPDSSSDGEIESPAKSDDCIIEGNKSVKSSKSVQFSLSQEHHQVTFGESNISQSQISPTQENNIITHSAERWKQIRARRKSGSAKETPKMDLFSVLSTPKRRHKSPPVDKVVIEEIIDDDDDIAEEVKSETSGRFRCNLTSKILSSINTSPSGSVINISDDEVQPVLPIQVPSDNIVIDDDSINIADNIIDLIEKESDEDITQVIAVKKKKNKRNKNKDDEIASNNDSIITIDSSDSSPKIDNSKRSIMNKSDEDLRGFGTCEKSSQSQHHISRDNEDEEVIVNDEDEHQDKLILTPDSNTSKTSITSISLKPCTIDCSKGKKQADSFLDKKKGKGDEEDKENVGKLRCKKKSNSIETIEKIRSESDERESILSSENTSNIAEIPCVDLTPVAAESNSNNVVELERQGSEEKKKRGRKPGYKCKPKIKRKNSQLIVEKIEKPLEYPSTSLGMTIRVLTGAQADDKDNSGEKKSRRGRKPGGKNKPKTTIIKPVKNSPGYVEKRGRKKKIPGKITEKIKQSLNNNNNNEEEIVMCCIVARCCSISGCIHGNNHKIPGKLPSLPENPDDIFLEHKYYDDIQKIKEKFLAQETKDETADSRTALIEIADPISNGQKVMGFTVPLTPLIEDTGVSKSSPEILETTSDDTIQKPKIIQDEVFPKGTINHVPSKLHTDTPTPSTDSQGSPKREKFGIKSTIPCKRALNPSTYFENMDSKISSVFKTIWMEIPEIAALLESPVKEICHEEWFDEDTMDIPEMMKPPEKRQSLLSQSISNTDLQNGHTNTSALLNGLFSNPHVLSSSVKDVRNLKKIPQESSKSGDRIKMISNGQPTRDKKYDNKYVNETASVSPLTKENLTKLDESTGKSCKSTDVVSLIMNRMQPPKKLIVDHNSILSPIKMRNKTPENSKYLQQHKMTDINMNIKENRKRIADINLPSPEVKRLKKRGRWSLNDDDASSGTSNESRPSVFLSRQSRSSYRLSNFDKKTADGKKELIDAWLSKDVATNGDFKDENSHSPHSAKTHVNTPISTDDEDPPLQIDETPEVNVVSISSSKDPEEKVQSDSNSPNSSSSKTVANSLKESSLSCGIETQEKEKQNSFEAGDESSIREAPEAVVKTNSQVCNNIKERDEEDEDALVLDYEEDDFLLNESDDKNDDQDKPALKKSSPKRGIPHAVKAKRTIIKNPIIPVTSNQSPKKNAPLFNSPTIATKNKSSQSMDKPLDDNNDENLERGSTTSDLYQMANFERFASQTCHEFNDQYSRPNEVDEHESDDAYDPYAPVEPATERMFFPKNPGQYFRGLCYAYLKHGVCNRLDCTFHNNKYPFHLQNLPKAPPAVIELVLNHAISEHYFHLLLDIYPDVVKKLELRGIERICRRIYHEAQKFKTKANPYSATFYQNSMKPTVEALTLKGYTPLTIINVLTGCFLFPNDDDRKKLMRVLIATKQIPAGKHWDTFEGLIKQLDSSSPPFVIRLILEDCFRHEKTREYLEDIYEHVIKKMTQPALADFDQGLLRPFKQFLEGVEQQVECSNNEGNITPMPDIQVDFHEARDMTAPPVDHNYSIASPEDIHDSGRYKDKEEEETVVKPRRKSIKERLGQRVVPIVPRNMRVQESLDLIPIDRVSKSKSVYKEYLWALHCDLRTIQLSLKHRDYPRVVETLTLAIKRETQPFARGFYLILCKEIMSSADHLEAVIKLTVRTRRFRVLPLLYKVGRHLLIKLANDGVWIIAYRLLRILQRLYGIRETPKHVFLMAEIFIANQRPLQALALLNQYKLISKHRNKWALRSHLQDELLRMSVLRTLLMSLCQIDPQEAFTIFKTILQQQTNCYEPFDLSKYTDDICHCLLKSNKSEELIEMAALIVRRNLNIGQSTVRALIVTIFQADIVLARQLHQYATLIGHYPIINIKHLTCIRIDPNWTKEEMFLQIFTLFINIRDELGVCINQMNPKNVHIYLNFESISRKYNQSILNRAKYSMKYALSLFNPKIEISHDIGRFSKLSSVTVITFLNSTHFCNLADAEK